MRFNTDDRFVRFLARKAHGAWSSTEVIDIFKMMYGKKYDTALANFLMDSLETYASKPRKKKTDVEYEKLMETEMVNFEKVNFKKSLEDIK